MSKGANKGGRPPALEPTDETLKLVRRLGRIEATMKDCAAFFEVTEKTFIEFKKRCPEAAEAYDDGFRASKVSLRMAQFRLAVDKLNPTMLIWLGKQHLGQRDHRDISGPNGGPIQTIDLSNLTDEQLAALEPVLSALAGASGGDAEAGAGGEEKAG